MTKITSPISILEFGSTSIRLVVYDKLIINQSLFFENKIKYSRNENLINSDALTNLIMEVEKNIGQHLNEVFLTIDSSSMYSIDLSMRKIYDKKIVTNEDIDYLINECKNLFRTNNKEKEILHTIKSEIIIDDKSIQSFENISQQASKVTIDLKFIIIDKKIFDLIKDLFFKKHISLKKIFCASYIKSLGLINKIGISGYSSFIDIGLKKTSLSIFRENKLLYLNNIHIGGDHITKDISKILKIDYRTAEAQKLKFSKNTKFDSESEKENLLKKIINSRLEEIIELLFLNCPLIKNKYINSGLKLFFTGNGSKVLNENFLSFGPEFNFIIEMSIINEEKRGCCDSVMKFNLHNQEEHSNNAIIYKENKGFFERLFNYFTKK